ncbi:ABC transporter permease [Pontibacillus marinus]|uniref:ABC transmembrane type-1 domain-containing protein n=1 Tax=Pontibacillus marinus BH030004 = DSM 16465 TaxID=1385511 RepID=A0A0A5GC02_9BACI|nr:ABC transporter permease subunit [Pontibacillus marinus]KGX88733.1 hypothetical protein N783_07510 [Pontibacillus marinus BH030004 = DSM 16465]
MKRNRQLKIGIGFLVFLILLAFVGPYLPFVDQELETKGMLQAEDGEMLIPPFPPSGEYWFGSDHLGRDIVSRLIIGTKEVLVVVLSVVLIRYIVAVPLGLSSYYYRSANRLLQFLNQVLSFVPVIFIVLLLINMPYLIYSEYRAVWMILILALVEVGRVADVILKQTVEISQKPYIETAIVSGNSPMQILRRYFFPQLFPQVAVNFTLDISRVMFLIGQLGLIHVFIRHKLESLPTMAPAFKMVNTSHAWPVLFKQATYDIFISPWIPFSGAVAITLFVVGFYVLGNGIRNYYEKKQSYL